MSYEYRVFSQGITSFSKTVESYAEVLSQMLNDDSLRRLTDAGWELWRIEKFDQHQGNHGFLVILRRRLS